MAYKADAQRAPEMYGAEPYPPAYPQAQQYGYGNQQPVYGNASPYAAQAPPTYVQAPPIPTGTERWTSGLCGCCNDCFSCCLTCWLPCVAFGQIAQKVDDAEQSACFGSGLIYTLLCIMGLPCCYSCLYRGKMRRKYHLPQQPCNDFCTHCCCEMCALCQEYRELQNRGIDPTQSHPTPAGFQQRGSVMMPPTRPMMQ